jgi:hypothetical protein
MSRWTILCRVASSLAVRMASQACWCCACMGIDVPEVKTSSATVPGAGIELAPPEEEGVQDRQLVTVWYQFAVGMNIGPTSTRGM